MTPAPTLRFRYNVKSCLRDLLLQSTCDCGVGGLECFKSFSRRVCLLKYQQKNKVNDRNELETFFVKTRIAYKRECDWQNGKRT